MKSEPVHDEDTVQWVARIILLIVGSIFLTVVGVWWLVLKPESQPLPSQINEMEVRQEQVVNVIVAPTELPRPTELPSPFPTQTAVPTATPQPSPTPDANIPTLVAIVNAHSTLIASWITPSPMPSPTPINVDVIISKASLSATSYAIMVCAVLGLVFLFAMHQNKPVALRSHPVPLRSQPVALRSQPVALRSQPLVKEVEERPLSDVERWEKVMKDERELISGQVREGYLIYDFPSPAPYEFTRRQIWVLRTLRENGAKKEQLCLCLWGKSGTKSFGALNKALED